MAREIEIGDLRVGTSKLDKDLATSEAKIQDVVDTTKVASGAMGELGKAADNALGGVPSRLKEFSAGLGTVTKGFGTLRVAIAATGIGLLLTAFGSLVAFFERTEEGAKALRVITASLGAALDQVADIAVRLGEFLFNAFNEPQEALDSITTKLRDFFLNAINQVLKGVGLLGEALSDLFAGEFDSALEKATEGAIALGDGLTDLNPATAIFKELAEGALTLGQNILTAVDAAAELETSLNNVKTVERDLRVERAQTATQIEQAKLDAQDLTKSTQERLAALKEAAALEQSLVARELANERERLSILEQQAALSSTSEETLNNIADQRIRIADLEAASFRLRAELQGQINALAAEERRIREENLPTLQKSITIQQQSRDLQDEIANRGLAKETEALAIRAENQAEFLQADLDRERQVAQAKVAITQRLVSQVADLLGKESEAGKALGVANALISTYSAAAAAIGPPPTGFGPTPVGFAAAASAVLFGLSQVKQILAVKTPGGGSGGSPRGVGAGGGGFSAPPVGQAIGLVNPLAQGQAFGAEVGAVLGGQPLRAYTVGQEVTTQQGLDDQLRANGEFG